MILAYAATSGVAIAGCSTHEVDTAPEWCEQISGVDLVEKYSPWWAVLPGVKFDGDKIRADFARTLNEAGLKAVQNRTERMAWVDGTTLHVMNPGNLNEIEPERVIEEWREGLASGWSSKRDSCVMPSVVSLFDRVDIHTWRWDELGFKVIDDQVTSLDTQRKEKLKDRV